MTRLVAGEQWTMVEWARAAVEHADLEDAVLAAWAHEPLWNRKR